MTAYDAPVLFLEIKRSAFFAERYKPSFMISLPLYNLEYFSWCLILGWGAIKIFRFNFFSNISKNLFK